MQTHALAAALAALAPLALAPPSRAQAPDPPVTIDDAYIAAHGGLVNGAFTVSGNWQSQDLNTPAVTIRTTDAVTIRDSNLRGPGDLIDADYAHANVTVVNTAGYGVNPNVAGKSVGNFLFANNADVVDVEHCYLEHVKGIVAQNNGVAARRIAVLYNQVKDLDGRFSDGNGGYGPAPDGRIADGCNFVGLDKQASPGIEVAWNQVINEPGNSAVEDEISTFASRGTSDGPILIHDNYLQGHYPPAPADGSHFYTGTAINIGDYDTDDLSVAPGYVRCYNNQVVSDAGGSITVSAGHDNELYGNRVVTSGLLPDGSKLPQSGAGIVLWDFYGNQRQRHTPTYFGNFAHDNSGAFWNHDGHRFTFWFPDGDKSRDTGNQDIDVPAGVSDPYYSQPTLQDEANEYTLWQQKLSQSGVTVGPTSAVPFAGQAVTLQAQANGRYVCADNAGASALVANRAAPYLGADSWEEFQVVDLGGGYAGLKALADGKYVTAGAGPLIADSAAAGAAQGFKIVDEGGGLYALQARANGQYVCADSAGSSPLIANRGAPYLGAGSWEEFKIVAR
jgi:hypothetical protein